MLNIVIKRDSPVPLYFQLKEELLRLIRSGEVRTGDVLPSESEFCSEFHLSRGTVRHALSILSEQGFVTKDRGKGSYVTAPKMDHDLLGEHSFGRGIRKLGMKPYSRILIQEEIVPRLSITKRLELEKHSRVFHIERIRLADQEPWVLETTYLPLDRFPDITSFDFTEELVTDILAEHYGVILSMVSAYVEPITLNTEYAAHLNAQEGLPALVVDRVVRDLNGKPTVYSHAVMRGDRCRYYFKT